MWTAGKDKSLECALHILLERRIQEDFTLRVVLSIHLDLGITFLRANSCLSLTASSPLML